MGNELSQLEEEQFYKTEFEESLDSPKVNEYVNAGTTVPNCQPKHTREEQEKKNEGDEVKQKYRRSASSRSDGSEKRRSNSDQNSKPSYIQMAKMGYQELVNAIIRPPRAEYKVCT
jgi:uncharacterized Zn finger protein (UPF0148 family)